MSYLLRIRQNRLQLAEEDLRTYFLIEMTYTHSNFLGLQPFDRLNENFYDI